jgi:hypothetical protein
VGGRRAAASAPLLSAICCLLAISRVDAWQQRVAYGIKARLDTKQHFLFGEEGLWYWNNSPDTLEFVWIHLYPNAYRDRNTVFARELERQQSYGFSFAAARDRGYIDVRTLAVNGEVVRAEAKSGGTDEQYVGQTDETEIKVRLPQTLPPGDSVRLEFEFEVKIPAFFSRLGHKGRQYVVSQWYPKMVVYDQQGWHPDGYHAIGEFYGEFGTFDVAITLPSEMVVGATGDLIKGSGVRGQGSVDPDSQIAWMKLKPKERPKFRDSLKTLLFHAENVHDFCWVADPDFALVQNSSGATTVNVLVRKGDEKKWRDVPEYARKALEHYSSRYGPYPYSQLTIADASLFAGGGMEYPNLVVISTQPVPLIRLLEQAVIHEIGHQWFYGMLGSNEMAEAWLDEGINTFAEMRYFEETYGERGNLWDAGRVGRLSWNVNDRYYQQLIYHVTATNGWLKPILTPAHEFNDEPIAYAGVQYAEAGLVVRMLRQLVGDTCFDRIMQTYCARFRFRHPTTSDFVSICEEVSGRDLHGFFDQWLKSGKFCDYEVSRIAGSRVWVLRKGEIRMPVEVRVRLKDGSFATMVAPADGGVVDFGRAVAHAELDPDEKLLEVNRWNNFSPAKVEVRPLFDLPSFESYQLFYGPYAWFDLYHGLQIGPWLMGRRFVDYGPLHGAHQWLASVLYRTRLQDFQGNLTYSTPLTFVSDRLGFDMRANVSDVDAGVGADLTYRLGRVLGAPNGNVQLGYRFTQLRKLKYLDSLDFELDTIGLLAWSANYTHLSRNLQGKAGFRAALASTVLGGRGNYYRVNVEATEVWRMSRDVRLQARVFGGASGGSIPLQQQFFLSGSLEGTDAAPINWSYLGDLASQEHWHIDGDASMAGYIGQHVKGRYAGVLNLSLKLPWVSPFFDIGNVGNSPSALRPDRMRMDAGIRLNAGPVYAVFPIWVSPADGRTGRNFAFRWALGLNLNDISIGL